MQHLIKKVTGKKETALHGFSNAASDIFNFQYFENNGMPDLDKRALKYLVLFKESIKGKTEEYPEFLEYGNPENPFYFETQAKLCEFVSKNGMTPEDSEEFSTLFWDEITRIQEIAEPARKTATEAIPA